MDIRKLEFQHLAVGGQSSMASLENGLVAPRYITQLVTTLLDIHPRVPKWPEPCHTAICPI